jgi:hypothetical protein
MHEGNRAEAMAGMSIGKGAPSRIPDLAASARLIAWISPNPAIFLVGTPPDLPVPHQIPQGRTAMGSFWQCTTFPIVSLGHAPARTAIP